MGPGYNLFMRKLLQTHAVQLLLPLLALPLLAASCNNPSATPPPSASGVYRIDLSCNEQDGILRHHIFAHEGGVLVLRYWGMVYLYDPDFGGPGWRPEIWGAGPSCLLAPRHGLAEAYLKRARDGQWVRSWREAGVVEGAEGTPRLELGELQVELVREEELPFALTPGPDGRVLVSDRPPLPIPFRGPRGFCLQPGAAWPWGKTPGNTSPHYPPVAPASPPAYYYAHGQGVGYPMSIEYINGRYVGVVPGWFAYAMGALPPSETPYRIVIYSFQSAPWHPNYGRWVRVYLRQPLLVRLEGGRLVCQNGDEGDWTYEVMPEGFNFPGYDPATRDFKDFETPYYLPAELDPYQGGR